MRTLLFGGGTIIFCSSEHEIIIDYCAKKTKSHFILILVWLCTSYGLILQKSFSQRAIIIIIFH